MKNIIVLHYKNGEKREIKWGSLPGIYEIPNYKEAEGFNKDNEENIASTMGTKTFLLNAKIIKGHLWWQKIYGHYFEQKMESPSIKRVRDVRETYNKKKVSHILF